MLEAACTLFFAQGEEKHVPYKVLFQQVKQEVSRHQFGEKITIQMFIDILDELEYYSLLRLERNKKDKQSSMVGLGCDLAELDQVLSDVNDRKLEA